MIRRLTWIALVAPTLVAAQDRTTLGRWVGAPLEEYSRILQLTGVMPLSSGMIRPTRSPERWDAPDTARWRAPWSSRIGNRDASRPAGKVTWASYAPVMLTTYNSGFAFGQNDGALWQGRGFSSSITAGIHASLGPVTVDAAPTYAWSENRAFDLGPFFKKHVAASPYADQFESIRIDRPQRFGERAFSVLDAGQSAITYAGRNVRAGVASRNLWWGPGLENAIIFTNNAAGFPHTFVATDRPANTPIGRLEVMHVLGTLRESKFWRVGPDTFNHKRWLNGLALVLEPKGAPGMYFGISRLFYAYQELNPITPREVWQLFQPFEKKVFADSANPEGNDTRDQMLSLSFRWVFPSVGFEGYGEWAKNDHNWDRRDAVLQPDHARGVLLGVRKVFPLSDGILSVGYETTTLSFTITHNLRDTPPWYVHHKITQGFTNFGQVLGAGIGPGSSQQKLSVYWWKPSGRFGFEAVRQSGNSDGFWINEIPDFFRTNASVFGGPRVTRFFGPVQVDLAYQLQYEFNRYTWPDSDVRNHRLEVRAEYAP